MCEGVTETVTNRSLNWYTQNVFCSCIHSIKYNDKKMLSFF